jgi:hypothetical protein
MTRKNSNPLEKEIEKAVCERAKKLGCLTYKFTSPARRSVPDRLIVPQGLPPFFIEFKRRGEKPTDSQKIEIQKIRDQGTPVFIIDDVEQGCRLLHLVCTARMGSRITHCSNFGPGCTPLNLEEY